MSATHQIHVLSLEDQPEVWLDTQVAECDGICLGVGETLAAAKAGAIEELTAAIACVDAIDIRTYPLRAMAWTNEAKRRRALNGAAPELLEAAKHAAMEWRLHGQLTDSCRVLEAAIARAEGRL